MSDNIHAPVQVPDTIIVTRDERYPPAMIGGHGSVPPTLKVEDMAFATTLLNAPRVVDRCTNCASKEHLFRACEEPLRNEDFEVAALRAKGLIRDSVPAQADVETKVKKENVSLKTEGAILVSEKEVDCRLG